MRKLLLTAAVSCLTIGPSAAFAQSDDDESSDDSMTEGGATVAPEPRRTPSPSTTGKASVPGAQHTVEKGDTLWDLSQKFLGSPWYWPKVWSYNPEIANPHWIYPGNEVRFYSQGEEVPTQVEVGEPETSIDEGELYDDKISVTGPIGFRPKNAQSIAVPGFVTTNEIEESGKIVGSFAENALLAYPDHIYVKFAKKAPKLGEIYVVYRSEGELTHPITLRPIGYYTMVLAEVKVIRVDKDNNATVVIHKQYDEVHRGDLIGPSGDPVIRAVAARPNERAVKDARLVADVRRYPSIVGEHQLAVMDKGSDDGVKIGNTFTFWRQHDPISQEALLQPTFIDDHVPAEDVGECVVFEVKARASICLVSRSIRDLTRGERAEIRVRPSRRASR